MPLLGDIVDLLESHYDPSWAEPWDAVGLVCGDPAATVRRVHLAVDPVAAVVDETLARHADVLVTHHPLFLGGTTSVAATSAKGRVLHRLVSNGVALFVAHTNADVASPDGVSDALAAAIGLRDVQPLAPLPGAARDKLVTFVPREDVGRVLDALDAAGAGTIGAYTRCAFLADGTGTFRAGVAANPTVGERGAVSEVAEARIEMVMPRGLRAQVVRALLAAHPYEEPAFDIVELAAPASPRGLGRVGELPESLSLEQLTRHVAAVLPRTAWGVRAAGDPDRVVRRVAVCGGSGGSLADAAARAGADVLVTSDLKHHATSETLADGGPALVDAGHWATEWPWLQVAAGVLATTVETSVSRLVTDPWTVHSAADLPTDTEDQ